MKLELRALNAAQIIDGKLNETHSSIITSRSAQNHRPQNPCGCSTLWRGQRAIRHHDLISAHGNRDTVVKLSKRKNRLASAIERDQRSISSLTTRREKYQRNQ
jgi:hypothetical protein